MQHLTAYPAPTTTQLAAMTALVGHKHAAALATHNTNMELLIFYQGQNRAKAGLGVLHRAC
jgi:hypothetical protein